MGPFLLRAIRKRIAKGRNPMKTTKREYYLSLVMGFALGAFACTPAQGQGGVESPEGETGEAKEAMSEGKGPITDTHMHLWDTKREIRWPTEKFTRLYRDVFPADYKAVAEPVGITGAGIVEASDVWEDQLWVLDQVLGDPYFKFYAAMLEVGAKDFEEKLNKLLENDLVVGIRGFFWAPTLTVDAKQVAHCKILAEKGLTLDIISRGDQSKNPQNPKAKVIELARAVPNLKIIIDHLAGAFGEKPNEQWVKDIQELAKNENVYIKFSSFFDMFNTTGGEEEPWDSPGDLAAYKPHFDVLFEAFGPDRMIWGSNWPIVEMGGTIEKQVSLAEEYLEPLGKEARDNVMNENALSFYKRD